jgi:hypothetical protein
MPAQVKRQRRSTSQPPIVDVQDCTDSHGSQLHSIPEDDDHDDGYGFSNGDGPGFSFQPLFLDNLDGAKDFFTALSSNGPARSDSELRDFSEDGMDDEDFTKDLNNVSDSSCADLDGSGSESQGSDDAFLASRLPVQPVNKRSAKPSSTTNIKSSARAKPSYDPQTCRKCFMTM